MSRPADVLRLAVVVGALGVVFGDIGTSPIYTLQTVFNPADPHPVPATTENVYGVVSLIFWSMMLIVTITYVLLAMRVDNDGEGGIMALITLLRLWARNGSTRTAVTLAGLGLLGAAQFLGDSMSTPAISVLSAVEGLKIINPEFEGWIVPVTAVIIVLLFAAQKFGTAAVGRLFGPVMIAWFTAIGACGIWGVANEPGILRALSPTYAIGFPGGALRPPADLRGLDLPGAPGLHPELPGPGRADPLFVAANLTKLVHGAWLTLFIAVTAFTVMTTWQRGREIVTAKREAMEGPLREFVERLPTGTAPVQVVRGTAIFLNRASQTAPLALRANVEHNHVRHEQVAVVAVETAIVPRLADEDRVTIEHLGEGDDGITHLTVRFGYDERPDVPWALAQLAPEDTEGRLDLDNATYFLSRIELRLGDEPGMAAWRRRLFIATSHITADAAEHFALPRDRTVLLGSHVDV